MTYSIPLANNNEFRQKSLAFFDEKEFLYLSQFEWYLTESGNFHRKVAPGLISCLGDELDALENNEPIPFFPESLDPIVSKDDPDPYDEEFHIPIESYKHKLWELN